MVAAPWVWVRVRGPVPIGGATDGCSPPARYIAAATAAWTSHSRTPGRSVSQAARTPASITSPARRMYAISAGDLMRRSSVTRSEASTSSAPASASRSRS